MISVYPNRPESARRLSLPGGQSMSCRLLGLPQAPAWLALHGGPGSGANPGLWRDFDLLRQRVVAPDQRGSGRSRPGGSLRGQSLGGLIEDLERLRRALGLTSWPVLGGSWGATLALLYAARHPGAVEALVLRGSFKGSRGEVIRLLRRFWPATAPLPAAARATVGIANPRHLRPVQAGRVLQGLSQLFRNATVSRATRPVALAWQAMEQAAALHGMRRAWLQAGLAEERTRLRAAWRTMEPARLCRRSQYPGWLPAADDRALWRKYRIQSHLLAHRCGLAPGQWDRALRVVAAHRIPVTWIHGRFDAVCPSANSRTSHHSLCQLATNGSYLVLTQAGHLGTEPANGRAIEAAVRRG